MQIFNNNIEKIREDIKEGTYKLGNLKNPDEILDMLTCVTCLNEILKSYDLQESILNKVEIKNMSNIFTKIALLKKDMYQSKAVGNFNDNLLLMGELSWLARENYTVDKKEYRIHSMYSDNDIYRILNNYYEKKDIHKATLLNYLIHEKKIYNFHSLSDNIVGTEITSKTMNEEYIFVKNTNSFETITTLNHELAHLDEKRRFNSSKNINKFIYSSSFSEVEARIEEKKLLDYLALDPEFNCQVDERYQIDYETFNCSVERLSKASHYPKKKIVKEFDTIDKDLNIFFGELMSDYILNELDEINKIKMLNIMRHRSDGMFNEEILRELGVTPYGFVTKASREYKKKRVI